MSGGVAVNRGNYPALLFTFPKTDVSGRQMSGLFVTTHSEEGTPCLDFLNEISVIKDHVELHTKARGETSVMALSPSA